MNSNMAHQIIPTPKYLRYAIHFPFIALYKYCSHAFQIGNLPKSFAEKYLRQSSYLMIKETKTKISNIWIIFLRDDTLEAHIYMKVHKIFLISHSFLIACIEIKWRHLL